MPVVDTSSSFNLVLKNKPFRILWFNQIFVQVATSAVNFVLIIHIFELTGKNIVSSLFVLMGVMPAMFLGLFSGTIADRFNKRTLMITTDGILAIVFLSFLFIHNSVSAILLLALVINIVIQFFVPTESATIPLVVPVNLRLKANALYYLALFCSAMAGYAVAGPLIEQFAFKIIFIGAALLMLIGAALCTLLPSLPSSQKEGLNDDRTPSLFELAMLEAREGIVYIYQNPRVWIAMVMLIALQLVTGVLLALGPGYMTQVLAHKATESSVLLLLPAGLGIVCGAVLVGRYGQRCIRRYVIATGAAVSGICVLALGLLPLVMLSVRVMPIIITMFLLGNASALVLIPAQTALQFASADNIRGRVYAILEMFKSTVSALPILLAGTIADVFGIIPVLLVAGLIIFITAIIFFRLIRYEQNLKGFGASRA